MSNATSDLLYEPIGSGGRNFDMPVDGGTTIYKGTMIAQLTATGMAVPCSTGSSEKCIGVATHGIDNALGSDGTVRVMVHSDRIFTFENGTATDACSEATLIGAPVYAADDHTVYDNSASGTLQLAGYFAGMEPDGRVRVLVTCESPPSDVDTTSIDTRISTTECDVASVETRISTTECDVASVETRLSTSECDVASVATALSTDVASIETRYETGSVPIALTSLREIDASGDVGNLAAHGGQLASDSTPILRADANESLEVAWVTGDEDAVAVSVSLPNDLDGGEDVLVDLLVASGTTDAATFSVKTSWNGGAQVSDTADDAATKSATLHVITATIAAADVPANPLSCSMQLIPDAHATNAILLQGVRVRYTREA